MAIVQVKYFNSFWLKKAVNKEDISSRPAYPYTKFLVGTSYVRGDYKLWLDPTTPAVVPIENGVNEYFVCIKDATHAASHQITPPFSPDRKSTRLNSSHRCISYAVFCLKKKNEVYRWTARSLGHYGKAGTCSRLTPLETSLVLTS